MARRYDEAIEQCLLALEIDPNYRLAYEFLARVYENMGKYDEAAAARQKDWILGGASEEEIAGLSEAAALGTKAYWRWLLNNREKRASQGEYFRPINFAIGHAQLDEKDQAFEWVAKAYEERDGGLITIAVDPYWDPLRDDPRFQDLLRRMNLEP
jgi:serine/threonine-protein kinase